MACREFKSGLKAREEIVEETFNRNVEVKLLDLSSLESIANFARDIHHSELTERAAKIRGISSSLKSKLNVTKFCKISSVK